MTVITKTIAQWEHEKFGTVEVRAPYNNLGEIKSKMANTWARIYVEEGTPSIELRLNAFRAIGNNIAVLHFAGETMTNVTTGSIPAFRVPVTWKLRGSDNSELVPHTRQSHLDNIDLIFLRLSDGCFVHLQISVVVRYGLFYVSLQEIYAGQIVSSTMTTMKFLNLDHIESNADGRPQAIGIIPAWDENSYHGSNYFNLFSYGVKSLLNLAIEKKTMVPLSDSTITRWEPHELSELPSDMRKHGWEQGFTLWFNQVIGWGFILCEDRKPCFVHFSAIIDEEGKKIPFPVLEPMVGVALRHKEELDHKSGQMRRKATAVRTA